MKLIDYLELTGLILVIGYIMWHVIWALILIDRIIAEVWQ